MNYLNYLKLEYNATEVNFFTTFMQTKTAHLKPF